MLRFKFISLPVCFLLAISLCSFAQDAGQDKQARPISYIVDLADAKNHYVTIEATVPCERAETELMMAVWTPGSYLVREYARHIDSIVVTDDQDEPLKFEKTRKNRWTIQTEGLKQFKISYRVYCNEMSVRTNWVGAQYAVLNGAPTFLTVPEARSHEHHVKLKMPKRWKRSATSLKSSGDANSYVASSFDELVDSPIVAGNIAIYPFEVAGVPHQLVNVGESGYWDGTKAAADLKKIVKAHQELWGTVPYDRYLFLNVICGSGGGLEHDNSCLMMTSTWNFRDESRYRDWLSLASHEFFHTWNVRRLRPKALQNYDYENETYTPSLWIAEGITSYYEDVLLVRAGLFSEKEYLGRLSRSIVGVQTKPGRKKQSLKDSSYDTWIKFYRPSPNSRNTQVSYYSKGAVVGFLLDAEIRRETEGEKSLDDVMQIMFERFQAEGYKPSDFRAVVDEVVGADTRDFFRRSVDSTDELDFDTAKEWFGFKFAGDKAKPANPETEAEEPKEDGEKANSTGEAITGETVPENVASAATSEKEAEPVAKAGVKPKTETDVKPKGTPWIGARIRDGEIASVSPDSPATKAGLNIGDEVLGVNGFRLKGPIDTRLKQFKSGDEIELLISRRGQLMTIEVVVESRTTFDWKWQRVSKPTDEQKANFKDWLGE